MCTLPVMMITSREKQTERQRSWRLERVPLANLKQGDKATIWQRFWLSGHTAAVGGLTGVFAVFAVLSLMTDSVVSSVILLVAAICTTTISIVSSAFRRKHRLMASALVRGER